MAPLMPDKVRGTHAFHPSTQARGAASLATSLSTTAAGDDTSNGAPHDTLDDDNNIPNNPNDIDDRDNDPFEPIASKPTGSPTPSSNTSSKRKHSALDEVAATSSRYSASQTASSSSKKPRSSAGAIALQSINASMATFSDSVRELASS